MSGFYKQRLDQIGLHTPQHPKVLNAEKIEFALKTQYTYSSTDTVSVCQFVYGPSWQMYSTQEMADLMRGGNGLGCNGGGNSGNRPSPSEPDAGLTTPVRV